MLKMTSGDIYTGNQISGTGNRVHIGPHYTVSPTQQSAELFAWLQPLDQSSFLKIKEEPGTNLWFLDGGEFEKWQNEPASCMWVHGTVGCGKSVLSASIIRALKKRRQPHSAPASVPRVLSYFFSFKEQARQDISSSLRSLIAQISPKNNIPPQLQDLYDQCNELFPPSEPSPDELKDVLIEILQDLAGKQEVYFIVDALDEVAFGPDRNTVLKLLNDLAGLRIAHVHLLTTSRPEPDIRLALEAFEYWQLVKISKDEVGADIRLFVENGISTNGIFRRLQEDTRELIRVSLASRTDPMFRWAALQFDRLQRLRPFTDEAVKVELRNLPADLEETYERMLTTSSESHRQQINSLLAWLSFSYEPLLIEQLVDVCGIRVEREQPFHTADRVDAMTLLELLTNLITVDSEDELLRDLSYKRGVHYVSLAHFSVKEFLIGTRIQGGAAKPFALSLERSHRYISASCLGYLTHSGPFYRENIDLPLQRYAWDYWAIHAVTREEAKSSDMEAKAIEIFNETVHAHYQNSIPDDVLKFLHPHSAGKLPKTLRIPSRSLTYETLAQGRRSIRLITLESSHHRFTELRGEIQQAALDDGLDYSALSFSWGSLETRRAIRLNNSSATIPPNLDGYLRDIRIVQGNQIRRLWLDALCISQDNQEEKVSQIMLMHSIFAEASEVMIALGAINEHDKVAIHFLTQIDAAISMYVRSKEPSASRDARVVTTDNLNPVVAAALRALHEGARSHMLGPSHDLNVDEFFELSVVDSLYHLFQKTWFTRLWVVQEITGARKVTLLFDQLALSFDVLQRICQNHTALQSIFSRCLEENDFLESDIWHRVRGIVYIREQYRSTGSVPLPMALFATQFQRTAHYSDRVYGLAGFTSVLNDPLLKFVRVDYNQDYESLYLQVSRILIDQYRSLDLFSYGRRRGKDQRAWPSWVSNFNAQDQKCEETHFDPTPLIKGIFNFDGMEDEFCATQGREVEAAFHDWRLTVTGMIISVVRHSDLSEARMSNALLVFRSDWKRFVRGRRFFEADSDVIGLGPDKTMAGDIVVVLLGGNVPYVLRPKLEDHVLIGECILPGFMKGEAIDALERGDLTMRKFTIV